MVDERSVCCVLLGGLACFIRKGTGERGLSAPALQTALSPSILGYSWQQLWHTPVGESTTGRRSHINGDWIKSKEKAAL